MTVSLLDLRRSAKLTSARGVWNPYGACDCYFAIRIGTICCFGSRQLCSRNFDCPSVACLLLAIVLCVCGHRSLRARVRTQVKGLFRCSQPGPIRQSDFWFSWGCGLAAIVAELSLTTFDTWPSGRLWNTCKSTKLPCNRSFKTKKDISLTFVLNIKTINHVDVCFKSNKHISFKSS